MSRAAWMFVAGSTAAYASVDIGRRDTFWIVLDLLGLVCALWLASEAKS